MNLFLTHGLSNKLRTLMGYLWLAEQSEQELNVCWHIDETCNGHFLDIFQPISGVNFVDFENEAEADFSGYGTFDQILLPYMKSNGLKANIYEEHKRMYRKLEPLPRIQEKVRVFCEKNGISTCIGMHIRRTDHEEFAKSQQSFTADEVFIDFIRNSPASSRVYIATDNRETQDLFASLYGDRVLAYTRIADSKALRKTSLEEALIDALVCRECRSFKGSGFSSYSDFIEILRSLK